ncbi:hypothetical protein [Streptomyces sp. NPDC050504]|uniref:SCO6745 family protein n=1 Tax=Streptomyces sp. NPDC050504 TaxID=3365618 RepID=UPI00379C2E5A
MDETWQLIETVHAPVYFAPEAREAYADLGLKGFWTGYFASRAAALGAAPAGVVTAAFHNFAPGRVARAVPDAWDVAAPERVLAARLGAVDRALRRLLGELALGPEAVEAADLARRMVFACPPAGRVLFAAHAALPVPAEPHLALWWAVTALREFRGDGHAAVLLADGTDGCEANVAAVASGLAPAGQRLDRGWTEREWEAAAGRLRLRGHLADDGTLSAAGRLWRARVEDATDRLARAPFDALGPVGVERLTECLRPLGRRIAAAGGVPFPNAMGLPPLPEGPGA